MAGLGGSAAPEGHLILTGGTNGKDGDSSANNIGGRGQHDWEIKPKYFTANKFSGGEGGRCGAWDGSKKVFGGGGGGGGILINGNGPAKKSGQNTVTGESGSGFGAGGGAGGEAPDRNSMAKYPGAEGTDGLVYIEWDLSVA